jgi:hypothetical protein
MEALLWWSDDVEVQWVGRWTEAERRPAAETREDLASIEIDAKSCALYRAVRLIPCIATARY